jgi:hypothetical protein
MVGAHNKSKSRTVQNASERIPRRRSEKILQALRGLQIVESICSETLDFADAEGGQDVESIQIRNVNGALRLLGDELLKTLAHVIMLEHVQDQQRQQKRVSRNFEPLSN